jgi:dienelactone hydrolase
MSRRHALDYAVRFAERGYVTLAPVQRGWNETAEGVGRGETGCQRMVLNAFLTGLTPLGLRCWDASRALDYLVAQPYVDASRIGVAGLSGGGMVGLFWAALDPRVRLAMIGGYYCTFRDSIYAVPHCACNCVPGIMRWGDMREIAALVAPRPLLIISGTRDPIFPIAGTRAAFRGLVEVYRCLGAADNLEADFFKGPHAWSNRKTFAFLQRHFGAPAGRAADG